MAETLHGT